MPDSELDGLRAAGILGNTSVSPDGKDLLAPANPTPTPTLAAPALGSLCSLTMGSSVASVAPSKPTLNLDAATQVVVLQNMVSAEEVADPKEMAEILEDTKLECGNHGNVIKVASPKPGIGGPPGSEIAADNIRLRVYVKFDSVEAAAACAKVLHGKMFDKRSVAASFISNTTFDAIVMLPCHSV